MVDVLDVLAWRVPVMVELLDASARAVLCWLVRSTATTFCGSSDSADNEGVGLRAVWKADSVVSNDCIFSRVADSLIGRARICVTHAACLVAP